MFNWGSAISAGIGAITVADKVFGVSDSISRSYSYSSSSDRKPSKTQLTPAAKKQLIKKAKGAVKEAIDTINSMEKSLQQNTTPQYLNFAEKTAEQCESATAQLIEVVDNTGLGKEFPKDLNWFQKQAQKFRNFKLKTRQSRFCNKLLKLTVELADIEKLGQNKNKINSQMNSLLKNTKDNTLLEMAGKVLNQVLVEKVQNPNPLFLEKVEFSESDPEILKNTVELVNNKLQNKIQGKDLKAISKKKAINDELVIRILQNTEKLSLYSTEGYTVPGYRTNDYPRKYQYNIIKDNIKNIDDIGSIEQVMLLLKDLTPASLLQNVSDQIMMLLSVRKKQLQESEELLSAFDLDESDPHRKSILKKHRETKNRHMLSHKVQSLLEHVRRNEQHPAKQEINAYIEELGKRDVELESAGTLFGEVNELILTHQQMEAELESLKKDAELINEPFNDLDPEERERLTRLNDSFKASGENTSLSEWLTVRIDDLESRRDMSAELNALFNEQKDPEVLQLVLDEVKNIEGDSVLIDQVTANLTAVKEGLEGETLDFGA